MKKSLLAASTLILSSFTAQAGEMDREEDKYIVTLDVGSAETDFDESISIVGLTAFKAKGERRWSFLSGIDIGFDSQEIGAVTLDSTLLSTNFGAAYGITDNWYVMPSGGFSFLFLEASANGMSVSDNETGFNVGADIVYHAENDFVFGAGIRNHVFEEFDAVQAEIKVGYTF